MLALSSGLLRPRPALKLNRLKRPVRFYLQARR
jgi:hypothetical protein